MKVRQKLYHGTDQRIVDMACDERQKYVECIKMLTDYLWNLYKPLFTEQETVYLPDVRGFGMQSRYMGLKKLFKGEEGEILFHNCHLALSRVSCSHKESQLYQYGDFYVTSYFPKANSYARGSFAFGESGRNVYMMLKGLKYINLEGYNPIGEIRNAVKTIVDFAEADPSPIIYELPEIDIKDLVSLDGRKFDEEYMQNVQDFRFLGTVDFNKMKSVEYKKDLPLF